MKILHVITCLNHGGAEAVLYRLISSSPVTVQHTVISMMDEGFYGPLLRSRGVAVHSLNMPRGRFSWKGLFRLHQFVRQRRPDVVQTWMYHANLLGGLAARLAGVRAIVWGIHNLNLEPEYNSLTTRFVGRISAKLSPILQDSTIFVSSESLRNHQHFGFRSKIVRIIANGIDLRQFRSMGVERMRIRSEWAIGPDEFLLGFVARWDRYKDHRNLFEGLAILARRSIAFRCALIGPAMDAKNTELATLIARYDLEKKLILKGPRTDIPSIMNALDLHVLSSAGEGFGNVTVEAMACGTPCVTTDVGGAALIVGDTGWIVPPRHPEALASAIEAAMTSIGKNGKDKLGRACRERIESSFDVDKMIEEYLSLWELVSKRARGTSSVSNESIEQ